MADKRIMQSQTHKMEAVVKQMTKAVKVSGNYLLIVRILTYNNRIIKLHIALNKN